MFVEGVRLFMVVLGTAAGFWVARSFGATGSGLEGLGGMLGCLAGYVGGGVVGRLLDRALGAAERRAARLPAAQVVAGALGAFGGGMVSLLIGIPIVVLVPDGLGIALAGLLVWISLWLGFRVVGARSAAMFEMLGLSSRPLVRAQAYDAHDGLLLDSSVIMDGQLLGLARAGLLGGDLMVPHFVLSEVQGFADGSDDTKARRAHRGLETLEVIKRDGPVRVYVVDDEVPEMADVDAKLAALARRLELRLLTNDAALARIAELQGVVTVNLRRLAVELAPTIMPGDFVRVFVNKRGRERDQGVGQLEDGSMVVVNGGVSLVGGPEVSLQVTSVVPTAMGRIVFTSVDEHIDRVAAHKP
ncbi:MAG TPA: PIN domain-containing protein [Acidimicrobiia bacterium]|jgi:uncharacterized protein YacL|nr:PIN domain-containing protein [Acidimicrobiia bacterium]